MSETTNIRSRYTCGGAGETMPCGWWEISESGKTNRGKNWGFCKAQGDLNTYEDHVCPVHTAYVAAREREQRRFEAAAGMMAARRASGVSTTVYGKGGDALPAVAEAAALLAALERTPQS